MVIGVKFCGGCNVTYDRGEEYRKLRERFPGVKFETYSSEGLYDRLLLICGCERTCLRLRSEFKGQECVITGSAEDMRAVSL